MSGRPRFTAIWCVGRNYAEHAKEMGAEAPDHPLFFMKNPAAVSGDGDPIPIHAACLEPQEQVDWEGELAVVTIAMPSTMTMTMIMTRCSE